MKVEDKIELQSVAKESCSSYLFMDGKFFQFLNHTQIKRLTLTPYRHTSRSQCQLNTLICFFFFLISLIHTKIEICFITCEQFLGESMK